MLTRQKTCATKVSETPGVFIFLGSLGPNVGPAAFGGGDEGLREARARRGFTGRRISRLQQAPQSH